MVNLVCNFVKGGDEKMNKWKRWEDYMMAGLGITIGSQISTFGFLGNSGSLIASATGLVLILISLYIKKKYSK